MKKGIKYSMAALIATSSITPVMAFAAEDNVVPAGVYNKSTGESLTLADFQNLTTAQKGKWLINANVYVVIDGLAYKGTNIVTLSDDALLTSGVPADTVINPTPEENTDLKVESVSAINARTMEVTFGQAVDPATVLDGNGNFKSNIVMIDGTSLHTDTDFYGEFDSANKTLTIYNEDASAWTKDTEYTVVIDGVKDKEANLVPKYAKVVKMVDTVAPTIESVKATTNADKTKNVVVEFSEPVNFTAAKVNGKLATASATNANYATQWTLTAADDLEAGKSYEVEFNGLTDLVGNAATASKTTVTIVKDTAKPTATATATGEKSLNVVFDKKMNTAVDVTSVKVTKKDSSGNDVVVPLNTLPAFKADGKTLAIDLAAVPFDNNKENTKELKVTVSGLKDSLGNTMTAYTDTVTVERDVTKPTIASVSQTPGQYNQVDVVFSEKVAKITSGENLTNIFKVTDNDGKEVKTAAGVTITVTGNSTLSLDSKNKQTLTLSAPLPKSGTYKLVVVQNKLEDTAAVKNTNDAQVASFTYKAATAAPAPQLKATLLAQTTVAGGTATDSTSSNRILVVNFDQADVVNGIDSATGTYKAGAADNPLNYTLNGSQLPEGTVVTFSNDDSDNSANDSVILDFSAVAANKLPAALTKGGNIDVTVSGVKTEAGSTIAYTAEKLTVADKTLPTMSEAYLTGNAIDGYELTLTFSEAMSSVDKDDFILTDGTNAATLASVAIDSTNETKAVFSVTKGSMDISKTLTLKTKGSGLASKDKAAGSGNVLEIDQTGITVTNYAQ